MTGNLRVFGDDGAGLGGHVAREQRAAQRVQRQAACGHALRIETHVHDAVRPADGVDVARARHALDLRFQRVRDRAQLVSAACRILRPQRHRD